MGPSGSPRSDGDGVRGSQPHLENELVVIDVAGGAEFRVRVIPRAGRTRIAGVRLGALLCRLGATPVDGAANTALVTLIADTLGIPARRVRLRHGLRGRDKVVSVDGLTATAVTARLTPHLND